MNVIIILWSYVGQILLLAVLITLILGRYVKSPRQRIGVVAVFTTLCLVIPVSGLSVGQWFRSVVGDLSIFTQLIFLNILMQRLFNGNLIMASSRKIFLSGIALIGLVFYPLALGVSSFDAYHLGYSPILMVVSLCLLSIVAWLNGNRDLAIILLLPLLAYNFKILESVNLWDYLLDPILLVYAVMQCLPVFNFLSFKKTVKTT